MTTALTLPGMAVERDLGVAFGLVVRSMGAVKSIGAGFKALRQGEVTQYTELLEDSRRHAIDRMIENARLLGANGVVAMRFDSSEIGQQLTEIVAYGTAVVAARPASRARDATARPPGPPVAAPRLAGNGCSACSGSTTHRATWTGRDEPAGRRGAGRGLLRRGRGGGDRSAGLDGAAPGRRRPAKPGRGRPGQRRRHAQRPQPDAAWVPTPERFRDPSTRAIMRVWIDPADLSRHYVPEPGG